METSTMPPSQGETWVLLRGLVREARHWEGFPERLQALRPAARVLTPDLPGNGQRCHEASPAHVAQMVAALRDTLKQQSAAGPCRVVALSLGGMVALEWLRRHPVEVEGLVLINSSVRGISPFWQRLQPRQYRRILLQGLLARRPEQRERMILDITSRLRSSQEKELLARRWGEWARSHPVRTGNLWRQLLAAMRYRLPDVVPVPEARIRVLCGARDALVHPDCSRRLAARWGLPLGVHPRGGHDLPLDDPDWVLDQIHISIRSWESRSSA